MGILIGTIALIAVTKTQGKPKQAIFDPYRVFLG